MNYVIVTAIIVNIVTRINMEIDIVMVVNIKIGSYLQIPQLTSQNKL